MIYGYDWLLIAIVAIIIADVRPSVAVAGPYRAKAFPVAVAVARGKRHTKERKVAETVMPEEEAVIRIEPGQTRL